MNGPLDDLSQLKPDSSVKEASSLLKYGSLGHVITAVVATLLAFFDVETVVAMGPICSVFAILLLIFNNKKIREYQWLAGSTLLFCLFCFLLIVGLRWSPREAQWPISVLAAVYTAWLALYYFLISKLYA